MGMNDMNQHIELVLQMQDHQQFDNNSFANTQQVLVRIQFVFFFS